MYYEDDNGDPIIPLDYNDNSDSKRSNRSQHSPIPLPSSSSSKPPKKKKKPPRQRQYQPRQSNDIPPPSIHINDSKDPNEDILMPNNKKKKGQKRSRSTSIYVNDDNDSNDGGEKISNDFELDNDDDNDEEEEYQPLELKAADFKKMDSMENEYVPPGYEDFCFLCLVPYQEIESKPLLNALEEAWINGVRRGTQLDHLASNLQSMYEIQVRHLLNAQDKNGIELKDIPMKASMFIKHFVEHAREINTNAAVMKNKFHAIFDAVADDTLEINRKTKRIKPSIGASAKLKMMVESAKMVLSLNNTLLSDNKRNGSNGKGSNSGIEIPPS